MRNPAAHRTVLSAKCPVPAAHYPLDERNLAARIDVVDFRARALLHRCRRRGRHVRNQGALARRRRHSPPTHRRGIAGTSSRVRYLPAVRLPPAAISAAKHQLARGKQRDPCATVRRIRQARRRAQLRRRDALDDPLLVRQRRRGGEQQPRGALGAAVAEHCLEQLRVYLAVPPWSGLSERQPQRACTSAPGCRPLHDHQAAVLEQLARLEEPAALQPRSPRRRRRTGTRLVLAIGEARQREGHKTLASAQVVARKRRSDRGPAHERVSGQESKSEPRVFGGLGRYATQRYRARIRCGCDCWGMRLKAIASPERQAQGLAMALSPASERAQTRTSPLRFRPRRG
jgi:hypothetical protein